MHESPHSSPPLSRETASTGFGQHRPGISLCSPAPELNGVQKRWEIYNRKGQVLLMGDKEEMWKEERERGGRK